MRKTNWFELDVVPVIVVSTTKVNGLKDGVYPLVADGVGVNEGVGVIDGVLDNVGVIDGVLVGDGVIDGVLVGDGVIDGVGNGEGQNKSFESSKFEGSLGHQVSSI